MLRRARGLQITGGALVALGVLVAVVAQAVLHVPAGVRAGVVVVVIGAVLLIVAAILRRLARVGRP